MKLDLFQASFSTFGNVSINIEASARKSHFYLYWQEVILFLIDVNKLHFKRDALSLP